MRFTVALMVRYLNQILDENIYPTEGIREASLRSRRIGVGFMGLGDLLAVMGLDYDRPVARADFAAKIAKAIRLQCERTTHHLATVDGPAPCFEGTDIMRRNAIVTSIQPTGTTAILLGVSTGIEPLFALENTRVTADGDVLIERPWSVGWLKSQGKSMPKVSDAIAPEDHVLMVSVVQAYIDNGISKTVNLPNNATLDDVRNIMCMAWEEGCKAVSIFRDGCRDKQVLTKCGDEVCAPGQVPDELSSFDTCEDEDDLKANTHHGYVDVWWDEEEEEVKISSIAGEVSLCIEAIVAGGLDLFGIRLLVDQVNKVLEDLDDVYRLKLVPVK